MAQEVTQATKHVQVVASPDVIDPPYIGLFVNSSGTVDITTPDGFGGEVTITYNVTVGSILPIRPLRITAMTADIVGLY